MIKIFSEELIVYFKIAMLKLKNNMRHKLFFIVCFIMASYMTYLQFKYYLSNEDVASISYKQFSYKKENKYPDFSISLYGINHIFNPRSDAFHSTNVTPYSYQTFLNARLPNHTEQHGLIRYDDVVLDINDGYLLSAYSVSSNDACKKDCKNAFGEQGGFDFPMVPVFKAPQIIWFSKDKAYQKYSRYDYELIHLNTTSLSDRQLVVDVFVHQKGQLIRNIMKTPISPITPKEYKGGIIRWFGIHDVTVLRRREDGREPCNGNLKDEDTYILRLIMKETGCIPTFWEHLAKNDSLNDVTEICTRHEQYLKLWKLYTKIALNFNALDSLYMQPCTQSKMSIISREYEQSQPNILQLKIAYLENTYTEITTTRAYTLETLLAQAGGFVGMI